MISIIDNKTNIAPASRYPGVKNIGTSLNTGLYNRVALKNNNFYHAIPVSTFKAYTIAFSSNKEISHETNTAPVKIESKHIESVVKSVKGKKFQGAALYTPEGETDPTLRLQWSKIKWRNLKEEPINWEKAKKEDVLAFWHALSLCETQETSWVNIYNPNTSKAPRAVLRSISNPDPQKEHRILLNQLESKLNDKNYAYLKKPLIDPDTGKFLVNLTVFDTETTGIEDNDRIIQLGAIKYDETKKTQTKSDIYKKFFDPGKTEISEGASEAHGLTKEILLNEHNARPIGESLKEFNGSFTKNRLLVAYNAKFDIDKINHEIDLYNRSYKSKGIIDKKERCVALDPYLSLQRIHPYVGARKKLGLQYRFLFCKGIEGHAHDALDDVKATADILKYTALYLNKHFTPTKKHPALTVADVLKFQFGGEVKDLNIKLNNFKLDKSKDFKLSYQKNAILSDAFPDGYLVNEENLRNLKEKYSAELGPENINTLTKLCKNEAMQERVLRAKRRAEKPEPSKTPDGYAGSTLAKKVFKNSTEYKIKPYNGNTAKKLIGLIIENIPNKRDDFSKTMYIKNVNPWDVGTNEAGNIVKNDLPDMEVAREVMLDKTPVQIKALVKEGKLPDLSHQQQPEYYAKFNS